MHITGTPSGTRAIGSRPSPPSLIPIISDWWVSLSYQRIVAALSSNHAKITDLRVDVNAVSTPRQPFVALSPSSSSLPMSPPGGPPRGAPCGGPPGAPCAKTYDAVMALGAATTAAANSGVEAAFIGGLVEGTAGRGA